jgi:hypothetical protein
VGVKIEAMIMQLGCRVSSSDVASDPTKNNGKENRQRHWDF